MENCVFCQIAQKKLPAKFIYEDGKIMVFPDIYPQAPLHLLIVPKDHLEDFANLSGGKIKVWEKMTQVVKRLIEENNLLEGGYRLVLNGGPAKLINHLHWHLMGKVSAKRKL